MYRLVFAFSCAESCAIDPDTRLAQLPTHEPWYVPSYLAPRPMPLSHLVQSVNAPDHSPTTVHYSHQRKHLSFPNKGGTLSMFLSM
jgi:hypothetical protein